MSVGIDIGSKTIKVVELARDGNRMALKSAGTVGYTASDVTTFRDDKEYQALGEALKKLFKDAKIASKNVTIALPETSVFTRILKFPLLNDQEIASAVKWEAEEYIPIPLKDAVVEHVILERQEVGNPPQVLVLLIAVTKDLVERYVKVAGFAGLNVVAVETELMAMVRSTAPVDKTAVLIDFGAHSTDLAIAKQGQLFFSRSIPTAGDAFTRAVAQTLGVSVEQAEEYKKTYGLSPEALEGKVGQSLIPVFRVVAEEIKKALHYYQLEVRGEAVSSVLISGGTAGLPGVATELTKMLGIEVAVANPFANVTVDPAAASSLANFAPLYSVAVGLALRGD